jgi:lipoprotein signal peptidase
MTRILIFLALTVDIGLRVIALSMEPISQSQLIGFHLYQNTGAIGSLPIHISILILFTSALLVLIAYLRLNTQSTKAKIGLELLFFGGFVNLIDRIVHGFTTDYILIAERSVLNIADILIFLGIGFLASYTIGNHPHKDAPRSL